MAWFDDVIEKIEYKHQVSQDEVEEAFYNKPKYKKAQKGKFKGEDLYYAYGRTDRGRYLFIVFIYKRSHAALIVRARDMNAKEKKRYAKK
ncbi:MAG: BrnT family toxin [bacterium]